MANPKSISEDEPVEVYDPSDAQETIASDDYIDLPIELMSSSRKSKLKWENEN